MLSEAEGNHFKKVLAAWMKLQEEAMLEIAKTLAEVMSRLDLNDSEVRERLESPAYLSLVKKAFRDWSGAESETKRTLVRNPLVKAASTKLSGDEVIRLYLEWIAKYSETHFKVIKAIYKNPHSTRQETWDELSGTNAREDSADADLFKTIVHDLSVGHIVRQHRETDYHGNFVRKPSQKRGSGRGRQMTAAFDDDKEYVLTELGSQFVHYTMNEVVMKISAGNA